MINLFLAVINFALALGIYLSFKKIEREQKRLSNIIKRLYKDE